MAVHISQHWKGRVRVMPYAQYTFIYYETVTGVSFCIKLKLLLHCHEDLRLLLGKCFSVLTGSLRSPMLA